MIMVSACNLGKGDEPDEAEAILTAAALTVQAQMAATATETPVPSPTPVTPTPEPSLTPTLPATSTTAPVVQQPASSGCDNAGFVSDVTVPDDTTFSPGEAFTKTWRLSNQGTCTWSADYQIVWVSGEDMDGPAAQNLTASVAPGQNVDISVDMVAPDDAGTYQGYWRLRNATGNTFGINGNAFWVKIKVSGSATTTAGDGTVTLTVSKKGNVNATTNDVTSNGNVGDNSNNQRIEAFVAFDISSIPDDATIDSAKVNFSAYTVTGTPFDLGSLRVYNGNFFSLDSGDLDAGNGPIAVFSSKGDLGTSYNSTDFAAAIQNALGNGTFELRFTFNEKETNSNDNADYIALGALTITVEYTP